MPIAQSITMPISDSRSINLTATTSAGAAYDLTGQTLAFNVYTLNTPPTGAAVLTLQKLSSNSGITINAPATLGTATINMVPGDTSAMAAGVYYFDVIATSGAGVKTTLTTGSFTLTDHPGR